MALSPGKISLTSTMSYQVPGGGNNFNGYAVSGGFTLDAAYSTGTGPNQAISFATLGATTTISTPVAIDLTTQPRADGIAGFTHVREIIIINDDPVNILKFDPTVANSQLFGMETAAKIEIQPGGVLRFSKPLGANGWLVDGTHHLVTIDPGTFAIPYRVLIQGD